MFTHRSVMARICLLTGLLATTFWVVAPEKTVRGEDPKKAAPKVEAPKAPPVDPEVIRLHLMDGSMISGKLAMKELLVETEFGSLNIPVTSVRSFTPGLGSHPEVGKRIQRLILDLGSSSFDEREAAQQELLRIGLPLRRELERHVNDGDNERRTRIKNILAELDQMEDDMAEEATEQPEVDRETYIERDTIETVEFTLVGKIVPQSFTITSLYGPLTVKLSDIRKGQRDSARREDERKSFPVDATHIVQRGFLQTTLRVERGDKVLITADGTMNMTPWGNDSVSTPEGASNFGWYLPNQIPGGALIARIGDNGPIFKAGTKHTFTAARSGVLQFAVGMQQDFADNNFPGHYNVKVRVKRK
jgi:hypothetical protein